MFTFLRSIFNAIFNQKKNLEIGVYIPKWDIIHNIAGVARFTAIFGAKFYIGSTGNRYRNVEGKRVQQFVDIVNHRERREIERLSMRYGTYDLADSFDEIPHYDNIVVMETPEFWKERSEIPVNLETFNPKGNSILFIYGSESEGILNPEQFGNYIPCYIPQKDGLVNTRNNKNNISLNLATSVIYTIGVLRGRFECNFY